MFVNGIKVVSRPQELFPAASQAGQPSSVDPQAAIPALGHALFSDEGCLRQEEGRKTSTSSVLR